MSALNILPQRFLFLKATDKNRTLCLISLPQSCSCSQLRRWNSFRKWKKNYIVQSEILTISLQERKVIKNDLCPPSFRIHVGKSINIPVWLLRFLVNFHICVDLPHKGTCSHVSDGTWKTNVLCEFLETAGYHSTLTLQVNLSQDKMITGEGIQ